MDPNLLNFLISYVASVAANLTPDVVQAIFGEHPDLEKRLSQPATTSEFESALGEFTGVLQAFAGRGAISINGAQIDALRSAHFDHQGGTITIGNARISAPTLQTGGTGSGKTTITGNTQLQSAGTNIKVGQGASIVVTGNAGIKQT